MFAALLLTALGGSLALLAQPSAASGLDSYDIRASVRYGCAQDKGEDNFVEVGLSAVERDEFAGHELVLQVGLAGPESDSYGMFPEGGPSLVTLGENPLKVRLAGPVHDGDHVFLRQLDRPEVIKLPLQATCHRIKPTNFGLDEPGVRVAAKSCTSGSRANLKVTLSNPNEVDRRLQKIGIEQIDYTVLLVRHDGLLAGAEPVGTMISFDEPSASVITLSQVAPKPADYQVRVIGPDGAVVTSGSIRLSCASTGPASSSPARPSPSVPTSAPVSTPPNSSRPAPSTPARPPTATVSRPPSSPAPTSSAASRTPTSSAPPATSQPVQPPPATSSSAGLPGRPTASSSSRPNVPTPRPSGSAAQPPGSTPSDSEPPSSAPAGPASSSPAPSPEPAIVRLVEPRADYGGLPVFQKEVALVVLAFAAAMAALVGATVVNARRR
ncbi:MAG: hypothetical protein ABI047_14045 [Jatrophihabitantaceae bacterium]